MQIFSVKVKESNHFVHMSTWDWTEHLLKYTLILAYQQNVQNEITVYQLQLHSDFWHMVPGTGVKACVLPAHTETHSVRQQLLNMELDDEAPREMKSCQTTCHFQFLHKTKHLFFLYFCDTLVVSLWLRADLCLYKDLHQALSALGNRPDAAFTLTLSVVVCCRWRRRSFLTCFLRVRRSR